MGHRLDERAVVGEQNQPLAVGVEPPDGNEPHALRNRDELNHGLLGEPIAHRADDALGFVEREVVAPGRNRKRLPIDVDFIRREIDFGSRRRHDRAVDGDPPGGDQSFGLTPRRHPGVRQGFLKPNFRAAR